MEQGSNRPTGPELEALAELFFQASDPTRLTLLLMLGAREHCVCELAAGTSVSVSAVSHQLRKLRSAGLVASRRRGRHVFYALADDHVAQLLAVALEHVRE